MAQLFDEKELLERADNDLEFLAQTVQMLEVDGRSLLAEIKAALAAGDAAGVGKTAHTLKGMVSNFCAPTVHGFALELERSGKAGDLPAAAAILTRLEPQLDGLVSALGDFVKARA